MRGVDLPGTSVCGGRVEKAEGGAVLMTFWCSAKDEFHRGAPSLPSRLLSLVRRSICSS